MASVGENNMEERVLRVLNGALFIQHNVLAGNRIPQGVHQHALSDHESTLLGQ